MYYLIWIEIYISSAKRRERRHYLSVCGAWREGYADGASGPRWCELDDKEWRRDLEKEKSSVRVVVALN